MQLEFTPEILEELNYERYRHPFAVGATADGSACG